MKVLMWGGETSSLANRGWVKTGFGPETYVGAGAQRLSPNQSGGLWALQLGSAANTTDAESPAFVVPLVESLHRVGMYHTGTGTWQFRLRNGGATIAHVLVGAGGKVVLYVNGIFKRSSVPTFAQSSWHTLTVRYRMLTAGGLFEVFVGADLVTPVATWTGDTDPTVATDIDAVQLSSEGERFDDVTTHAITMRYDGGVGGVPVVGETVTGAGAATALITALEAGSDATSGRLFLRSVVGTFNDNEQVTTGGTFDAVNNAPAATTTNGGSVIGLDTSSGLPNPLGYMTIQAPTAPGAFTECTPVPVVANWQNVDDWPAVAANEATFNTGLVTGDRDFYELADLGGSFSAVEGVEVVAWAEQQGAVINNIELAVRPAATEHYGPVQALGTFGPHSGGILDVNPEDGENWAIADVNVTQAGFRLTT